MLARILAALERDRFCALCAEPGMGTHVLAGFVESQFDQRGAAVLRLKLALGSIDSHLRRMRRFQQAFLASLIESEPPIIVVDGIALDDRNAARLARSLKSCALAGCRILLLINPMEAHFLSFLPEFPVLRSRDFLITREELNAWLPCISSANDALVADMTHGIPVLVSALRDLGLGGAFIGGPSSAGESSVDALLDEAPSGAYPAGDLPNDSIADGSHPGGSLPGGTVGANTNARAALWNASVESLMASALAPGLIDEELRLRAAMLLLGKGTRSELESLGVRASQDLLFEVSCDAPLFGLHANTLSFDVLACPAPAVGRALGACRVVTDDLVEKGAGLLAARGELRRAVEVASAFGAEKTVDALARAHPAEMLDVGLEREARSAAAAPATHVPAAHAPAIHAPAAHAPAIHTPADHAPAAHAPAAHTLVDDAEAPLDIALRCVNAPKDEVDLARARKLRESIRAGGWRALDPSCAGVSSAAQLQVALLVACGAVKERCHERDVSPGGWLDVLCSLAGSSSNALTRTLGCHLRVLGSWLGGCALEAFRHLTIARDLRTPSRCSQSVFSALLQLDFEALRVLVGDPGSPTDADALRRARHTLDERAPRRLRAEAEARLGLAASLASGDVSESSAHALSLEASEHGGESAVLARTRLVRALGLLVASSPRHAHVEAARALECAVSARATDVAVLAEALDRVAHACLGEKYPAEKGSAEKGDAFGRAGQTRSCEGHRAPDAPGVSLAPTCCGDVSADVGALAQALRARLAALGDGARFSTAAVPGAVTAVPDAASVAMPVAAPAGRGAEAWAGLRTVTPRVELLAVVACLSRVRLRGDVWLMGDLPPAWEPGAHLRGDGLRVVQRGSSHRVHQGTSLRAGAVSVSGGEVMSPTSRGTHEGAFTCGGAARPRTSVRSQSGAAHAHQRHRVGHMEVGVLGGVSVSVDGERLSEAAWKRTQSRNLLAMLALTPGHVVTRFEAIERLWPEADYARGRENLYTTLSSLRASICQKGDAGRFVVSEMGRIRLDESLVTCDVDEFESLARSVASPAVPDEETVTLCLRMEAMYGDGSHVPSQDESGLFRRRHGEIARRFVDSMLAGAEAAMRLRDVRQASWLAESASSEAAHNEGLAEALSHALKAFGGKVLGQAGPGKVLGAAIGAAAGAARFN